jgi:UDPglucose 6-dehydrogenase
MDIPSAEMTKYAANSMLATRISFMNDIANLCEIVGADIDMVRKGIGTDARIGNKFLYAGCGYGGSCFPKDVKALIHTAQENGYSMQLLEAVESINANQKEVLYNKLYKQFKGALRGKTIAVWGLAFKPNTDDMREAPSLVLINKLLESGAKVRVYDPIVKTLNISHENLYFANDAYDAAKDADAICLVTEWQEFRLPNWEFIKQNMNTPLVIDGRNIYDKKELINLGFKYLGIGK